MASDSEWLLSSSGHEGSVEQYLELAKQHQAVGKRHLAATAYDRAWSLNPQHAAVTAARRELLDGMSLNLANIVFRFIPGGSFLMGSEHGESDEKPVHMVQLAPFWMSETPISWARYCELMDWMAPPQGHPKTPGEDRGASFHLQEENKIRLQYCEDQTLHARDWHAHAPQQEWISGVEKVTAGEIFGEVPRERPDFAWAYDQKPMVAVSWQSAHEFCGRFSEQYRSFECRLPTEAEWEKAARGGLVGATYSWGNEPADPDRCDFHRFDSFAIQPPRRFAPNGYGLYGMCGGVWEWTEDWYDADYYRDSPRLRPTGPVEGKQKVLRGGSWADCAEAVTVSFRWSRQASSWREAAWGAHYCPNIGFRICCSATV